MGWRWCSRGRRSVAPAFSGAGCVKRETTWPKSLGAAPSLFMRQLYTAESIHEIPLGKPGVRTIKTPFFVPLIPRVGGVAREEGTPSSQPARREDRPFGGLRTPRMGDSRKAPRPNGLSQSRSSGQALNKTSLF